MTQRKMITQNVETIDLLQYGTLAEAAADMQRMASEYGATATFENRYHAADDANYVNVVVTRFETDSEMMNRVKHEEAHKAQRDAYDRLTYDRLKAKFG